MIRKILVGQCIDWDAKISRCVFEVCRHGQRAPTAFFGQFIVDLRLGMSDVGSTAWLGAVIGGEICFVDIANGGKISRLEKAPNRCA
jgi:hypothetical protein